MKMNNYTYSCFRDIFVSISLSAILKKIFTRPKKFSKRQAEVQTILQRLVENNSPTDGRPVENRVHIQSRTTLIVSENWKNALHCTIHGLNSELHIVNTDSRALVQIDNLYIGIGCIKLIDIAILVKAVSVTTRCYRAPRPI